MTKPFWAIGIRFLLGFFVLIFSSHVNAYAETVDRIIAKVGRDVVTMTDLSAFLKMERFFLEKRFGANEGKNRYVKIKEQSLDELVLQKVLEQSAKKSGVFVSDEEVAQAFEQFLAQLSVSPQQFESLLYKKHLPLAAFKERLKIEVLKQKISQEKVMPKISISDHDLKMEYEKHKQDYVEYKKVRFVEVLLSRSDFSNEQEYNQVAETIHKKLLNNRIPKKLIQKHSVGPFSKNGGDSGLVPIENLRPEIQAVLSKLSVGEVSPVFPGPQGAFIFKLLDQKDPQPLPFNKVMTALRARFAEVMVGEELRRYLMTEKERMYVEMIP